jgi:hypothetical protein
MIDSTRIFLPPWYVPKFFDRLPHELIYRRKTNDLYFDPFYRTLQRGSKVGMKLIVNIFGILNGFLRRDCTGLFVVVIRI